MHTETHHSGRRPRPETIVFAGLVVDLLAEDWVLEMLEALADGPLRSSELLDTIPGLSYRSLQSLANNLVRDGLVAVDRYDDALHPIEYCLTELGRSLTGPIEVLADWGSARIVEVAAAHDRFDTGHPAGLRGRFLRRRARATGHAGGEPEVLGRG